METKCRRHWSDSFTCLPIGKPVATSLFLKETFELLVSILSGATRRQCEEGRTQETCDGFKDFGKSIWGKY